MASDDEALRQWQDDGGDASPPPADDLGVARGSRWLTGTASDCDCGASRHRAELLATAALGVAVAALVLAALTGRRVRRTRWPTLR
jgi:hypothetical protein